MTVDWMYETCGLLLDGVRNLKHRHRRDDLGDRMERRLNEVRADLVAYTQRCERESEKERARLAALPPIKEEDMPF